MRPVRKGEAEMRSDKKGSVRKWKPQSDLRQLQQKWGSEKWQCWACGLPGVPWGRTC